MKNKYIGHPSQLFGVRETRMVGGKADGMRLLEVRNGNGLEFTVSLDRGADIPYLFYKGKNMAYISPCGMVAPQYYDNNGLGFLKSFTAGFFTTCGLTAVGSPCTDNGEELPLHGTISHIPAEQHSYTVEDDCIKISALMRDAVLFGHQLVLKREYRIGLDNNTITLTDTVENIGSKESPFMIMYHCNFGYPLLSENAELNIPSCDVIARNQHAIDGIADWNKIPAPTPDFVEQCYYHKFNCEPVVTLKNPDIGVEMEMTYDSKNLDCFTQWKMLGDNEYVMGLEPGNCTPDGRDVMRKEGNLKFLKPGETKTTSVTFKFSDI